LYFLPLPQGQGSLRPTRGSLRRTGLATGSCSARRASQQAWIALTLGAMACWIVSTSSRAKSCPRQFVTPVKANIGASSAALVFLIGVRVIIDTLEQKLIEAFVFFVRQWCE
jgi:hypothetical protein